MLALFRKKPVTLDPPIARFILDHHDDVLDVHERAALYAARVAEDQPREGSHGAKVLQIWENTATDDSRLLVQDGLEACETQLARRVIDREGRGITVSRCDDCARLHDGRPKRCACGGRTRGLRLR